MRKDVSPGWGKMNRKHSFSLDVMLRLLEETRGCPMKSTGFFFKLTQLRGDLENSQSYQKRDNLKIFVLIISGWAHFLSESRYWSRVMIGMM